MRLLAFLLATTTYAVAAPPTDADISMAPWYRSLHIPETGGLCCDMSDCRHYPVTSDGTRYWVYFEQQWREVPRAAVLDRTDNPTGDYVVCIQRDHWTSGQPDGPIINCLVRAPGM
jgi:hypothetical protein